MRQPTDRIGVVITAMIGSPMSFSTHPVGGGQDPAPAVIQHVLGPTLTSATLKANGSLGSA